ncbi:MAG TPA: adenosine kinase [Myxococcota bacterium]|nr:adenosine kinase [Myxococcota bacterium]HRY96507.1 adenosine kinase [Myxococcota bacterium]HSA24153.1 adenosine kinase [Myxococcota bacterium]
MQDGLVLGIGNALTDILVPATDGQLQALGLPKGSMQLVDAARNAWVLGQVRPTRRVAGGCAANTITGLGRLGLPTAFIGKIGRDETGEFFAQNLRQDGVEPRLLRSEGSPSGTAVAFITPDSERTFSTHLGAAVELGAAELSPALFAGARHFHIEGYLVQNHALIEAAIDRAQAAGATVSIDLASYNVVLENLEFLRRLVAKGMAVVFANEEEARAFTGARDDQAALEALADACQTAVVKLGKRGSLVAHGRERARVACQPVSRVVDTTGAGDLYATGFLYGWLTGRSLEECAALGGQVAAEVIQVMGARLDEATWARIRRACPGEPG